VAFWVYLPSVSWTASTRSLQIWYARSARSTRGMIWSMSGFLLARQPVSRLVQDPGAVVAIVEQLHLAGWSIGDVLLRGESGGLVAGSATAGERVRAILRLDWKRRSRFLTSAW
jgi:hypothetical protein